MARTAAEIASLINAYGAIGGDVSVETVAHIQQRARIQTYRPGEFVTRRGQNEPRICIVLSGVVRLTAFTEDGREMLVHVVRPGDCWGVHPCLGGFHETNDAVVETGGEILSIKPTDIDWLMRNRYDFQKAMIGVLCKRLNLAISLAEQFGAWTARERVAWRLLLLSNGQSQATMPHFNPEIVISQETLASMVHLSRQRTNRLLKDMESEGLVALTYGRIHFLNHEGLRRANDRTA